MRRHIRLRIDLLRVLTAALCALTIMAARAAIDSGDTQYFPEGAASTELALTEILTTPFDAKECIDYCITGICFEVRYDPLPYVVSSIRVRHRHPEFVVGVHDWVHQQAWNEERAVYGNSSNPVGDASLQKNLGGAMSNVGGAAGSGVDSAASGAASALSGLPGMGWVAAVPKMLVAVTDAGATIFKNIADLDYTGGGTVNMMYDGRSFASQIKEANVTGAPSATAFLPALFCPRNSTTLVPYFRSSADSFEWRNGLFEGLSWETWWPFKRGIGVDAFTAFGNAMSGSGDTQWGWVKPRVGFVGGQVDDYKAAGVVAQRAVDIVTNPYGFTNMHVKVPYSGPPADEQSPEDVWQRLAPNRENICRRFGYGFPGTLDQNYQSKDRAYAFLYWRRYECCTQGVRPEWTIDLNICL